MKQTTQIDRLNTGIDTKKVTPINGHSLEPSATATTPSKRDIAMAKIAEWEVQLQALEQEEQEEAQAEMARLAKTRDGHLMDAQNFRNMAKAESDPDEKRLLLRLASEDDHRASEIGMKLGIQPAQAAADSDPSAGLPWVKRNRSLVALFQMGGILAAIAYCYNQFTSFGEYIQKLNEKLPVEQHLQPYDLTSIQKFFFEKMVVFTDLPIALLILFLMVPNIGFYVLPFLKSKRDFYTEFNEDLSPWQRSVLTIAISLGLLFFLALSHSVKP